MPLDAALNEVAFHHFFSAGFGPYHGMPELAELFKVESFASDRVVGADQAGIRVTRQHLLAEGNLREIWKIADCEIHATSLELAAHCLGQRAERMHAGHGHACAKHGEDARQMYNFTIVAKREAYWVIVDCRFECNRRHHAVINNIERLARSCNSRQRSGRWCHSWSAAQKERITQLRPQAR